MKKICSVWILALFLAAFGAACTKEGTTPGEGTVSSGEAVPEAGAVSSGEAVPEKGGPAASGEQSEEGPPQEDRKLPEGWLSVAHTTKKGSIALGLPGDWRYQIHEKEDGRFDVSIHPMSEEEGEILIQYTEGFAVCGTGLEEEKCAINGMEGRKGIYDGGPHWSFLMFEGAYRGYVIVNSAQAWWDQQEPVIDAILDTLTLGDDVASLQEVLALKPGQSLQVDDSGNTVCVEYFPRDETKGPSIHLTYGDQDMEVGEYLDSLSDSYVIKAGGGRIYVLVGVSFPNDYGTIYLYRLAGDEIISCDSLDAVMGEKVTANYIETETIIHVLGSYRADRNYSIIEDRFYSGDPVFAFHNQENMGEERRSLRLIHDISIDVWGEPEVLEAGSVIYPTGCDLENQRFYFEFEKEGSVEAGSLEYVMYSDRFGFQVEGLDEREVFEELPYAG